MNARSALLVASLSSLAFPAAGQEVFSKADFDSAMTSARAAAKASFLAHKIGEPYADASAKLPDPPPADDTKERSDLSALQAALRGVRDVQEGCAQPCDSDSDKTAYAGKISALAGRLGLAAGDAEAASKNYIPDGVPRKKGRPQGEAGRAGVPSGAGQPALASGQSAALAGKAMAIAESLGQGRTVQSLGTGQSSTASGSASTSAPERDGRPPQTLYTGTGVKLSPDATPQPPTPDVSSLPKRSTGQLVAGAFGAIIQGARHLAHPAPADAAPAPLSESSRRADAYYGRLCSEGDHYGCESQRLTTQCFNGSATNNCTRDCLLDLDPRCTGADEAQKDKEKCRRVNHYTCYLRCKKFIPTPSELSCIQKFPQWTDYIWPPELPLRK